MILKLMRNIWKNVNRDYTLVDNIRSIRKTDKLYCRYLDDKNNWMLGSDICYLDCKENHIENNNETIKENDQFPFFVYHCTTNEGKELKIVSDGPVYILNDEGKTIERCFPLD